MTTLELLRHCPWRFFAGRHLNAARYGSTDLPFSGSMALKTFVLAQSDVLRTSLSWRRVLQQATVRAWPAFAWRFGRTNYEPHGFAYCADGTIRTFDWKREIQLEQVDAPASDWDFVESQTRLDEYAPQVFGEAACLRFAFSDAGKAHVRFAFNHALVDGLTIFRFLALFEAALQDVGVNLQSLNVPEHSGVHEWRAESTRYRVEDIEMWRHAPLGGRHHDYLSILHYLMPTFRRGRVCQVVASLREPMVQLAIVPVQRERDAVAFRSCNAVRIRKAYQGSALSKLWGLYESGASTGDKVVRMMLGDRLLGRRLYRWWGGATLVSGFMLRHPRYLAFPVAHAVQREGVAVCGVWNSPRGLMVRVVRVRNTSS